MRATRYNSLSQLAGVVAGLALTIVPLESEALLTWAQRLEVSSAANVAVQATGNLRRALKPLNVEWVRREGLADLDRLGWSDDPARLKAAQSGLASAARARTPSCAATGAVGSLPAAAHGAAAPVSSSVPARTPLPQLPPVTNGKPRVVALAGDSMMAVGLSDMLLRETAGNKNVRVIKAFRSGTGLARPDVFDWMTEYPAMIGDDEPDAVIVAIGANDGQGFVEDGKVLAFGSDAWVRVYEQRTAAYLDMLTQDGARVVWVGLPPMKSGQFDEKTAEINRITFNVVSQYPQATWWNPQPYIGDDSGRYREFLTAPDGKTTRLRAPDGIHLSDEGAAHLSPALMTWLNASPPPQVAQLAPAESPAGPARKVSVRRRRR
jgi:hypothetical protein